MTESDPLAALIVALGTTLMRQCLGHGEPGDADAARRVCRQVMEMNGPREILAVATGGVWAAYRPDEEIDNDTWNEIAEVARLFLRSGGYDGLITLASATLILMSLRAMTDQPAEDLVLAAQGAWEIEHHDLALMAARTGLATGGITPRDRATALMLIARITNEPADIAAVVHDSAAWSRETADTVDIESLVPGPIAASDGGFAQAADAISAGNRTLAARIMADETHKLLASNRDPVAIGGMEQAFSAMSSDEIDVPSLRSGLTDVVRHLRTRQRFGSVPPAVRAALELAIFVLTTDSNEAMGSVLVELMEALADAGISEISLDSDQDIPAIVEAQLSDRARLFPLWPSLQDCVNGLAGSYALVCRNTGGGRTSASRWHTALVVPPDGVFIRSHPLPAREAALLDTFSSNDPVAIAAVDLADLDRLVLAFFHNDAIARVRNNPEKGLVIVPDGPLWNVPWQAAPTLRTTTVTLAPSLTVYASLDPPPRRIHHVVALVDDSVEGADLVVDELLAARASERLTVDFAPVAIGTECDLLIVLAHGVGSGLRFETALFGGTLNAFEVAKRARCREAVIAACWSAKSPPFALPLNLQTSLLIQGCSHCYGGAWPLPQRNTAQLIALVVRHVAAGQSLEHAMDRARTTQSGTLFESWGLNSTGRITGNHDWEQR